MSVALLKQSLKKFCPPVELENFFSIRIVCNGVATYEDVRVVTKEAIRIIVQTSV